MPTIPSSPAPTDISSYPAQDSDQLSTKFIRIKPTSWPSNTFVALPEEEHHELWLQWWTKTEWRRAHDVNIDWLLKRMTQACWEHFRPVADVKTGKPWALCRSCTMVLAHPTVKNAGTSSLKKHLASDACKKRHRAQEKQQAMQSADSSSSDSAAATIPAMFTSQSARLARQHVSIFSVKFYS